MAAPNRLTVPLDPAGGPGADAPHYHMAVGPARAGAVPIRKPTRHARTTMCKTRQGSMHTWPRSRFTRSWLAIPCGRLQLRTAQPSRRRRTGRHRRGGERPPRPRACYGRGARCVFTRWPPPSGGRSQSMDPLAGRPSSAAVSGVSTDRSGFRVSALVGQVRGPVEGQAVHGAEGCGLVALHAVRRTRGS